MSAEIADVLDKAAEVIETRGWHQGDFGSDRDRPDTCSVCAVGAVKVAAGVTPFGDANRVAYFGAVNALERYLEITYPHDYLYAAKWNDKVAADATTVIDGLRAAARAERDR